MKKILFAIFICGIMSLLTASGAETVVLDNGIVKREFNVADGAILSSLNYSKAGCDQNYIKPDAKEFSFIINDKKYDGLSGWSVSYRDTTDNLSDKGLVFTLKSKTSPEFIVKVSYFTYPELPLVKKVISFYNAGKSNLKLEALDVENFQIGWSERETWTMRYYGRYRHVGPYVGDWDDPLITLHDMDNKKGMAVGNEAPGVTKRTSALVDGRTIAAGLRHPDQSYSFRKWIAPGESFTAPAVFTALYSGTENPYDVMNTTVADYTRKYMGIRFEKLDKKPMFVYNTWFPFYTKIDEKLVMELADAAAECGVEEFIIDDGWQVCHGDWEPNTEKFPNGLKPVFDHMKKLGMKPGLWVTLGTAQPYSKVSRQHPEWFVEDKNGNLSNLHTEAGTDGYTACMATDWKDHIKNVLMGLVKDNGLSYAKLDFAIATSAYIFDDERTGCYSGKHPYHRDHAESYYMEYKRALELFDELHAEAPDLFIDCTYETAGKMNLNDYAIVKHAEGNWLSNIQQPGVTAALRMRLMAWQRSPALPVSTLVIGNLRMNDPEYELLLKSLAGALPIMLGDPRELSQKDKQNFKAWTDWLKELQVRHGYMSFRQDLPGFAEPAEGCWDGFMRINTETKSGGLIGVFRHGSAERERTVTLKYLDPARKYVVKEGKTGRKIVSMTGSELETEGFKVKLDKRYDGQLFEVVAL